MFRREKTETVPEPVLKEGGKGRPTPTRKEAEAAAKARARAPQDRKAAARQDRKTRGESSRQMRQAMKSGDERYLPARDRGPVKRFIRDFVDSRFTVAEVMIPILIVVMVLGYSGQTTLVLAANYGLIATLLVLIIDLVRLRFRVRREVTRRFGEDQLKGTTYYTLTRAMQMKFMRLPKSQVKIGQDLPDSYR